MPSLLIAFLLADRDHIDFEIGHFRNCWTSLTLTLTLTLNQVTRHSVVYHSSTSTLLTYLLT